MNFGKVTEEDLKKLEDNSLLVEVYGKHKDMGNRRKTQLSTFSADDPKSEISENMKIEEKNPVKSSKIDQIADLISKAEKDGKKKIKVTYTA